MLNVPLMTTAIPARGRTENRSAAPQNWAAEWFEQLRSQRIESEFKDLLLDFERSWRPLAVQKICRHAERCLRKQLSSSKSRLVWQEEMRALLYGVESMRAAFAQTTRLAVAAARQSARPRVKICPI